LKVEKKVYYFENKHSLPSPKKTTGVGIETNIPKKLESNNYAGTFDCRTMALKIIRQYFFASQRET